MGTNGGRLATVDAGVIFSVSLGRGSLVPRPLPDFISQPWDKSGGGLGTRIYRVEVYALFFIIPTLFAYLRFSAYLYSHLRFTSALLQQQYRQMHYLYHIRWFSISCITVSSFCYIFYPPMNTCLCTRKLNFLQSCVHFDLGHITIHMIQILAIQGFSTLTMLSTSH